MDLFIILMYLDSVDQHQFVAHTLPAHVTMCNCMHYDEDLPSLRKVAGMSKSVNFLLV